VEIKKKLLILHKKQLGFDQKIQGYKSTRKRKRMIATREDSKKR